MKRKFSAFLAIILCLALCLGTFASADEAAPEESPAAGEEPAVSPEGAEEVIYARLDAAGKPQSAYAVVALTLTEDGTATHYGSYTEVENLTDTSPIEYSGGKVTLDAGAGRYYYQGTLRKAQMPWDIEISYKLDGKDIAPGELGGRSGKLEVGIHTVPNSGFDTYFTDGFMLQISVTLDSSLCENISARNGTVASAGSDKNITFVILPGGEGDVGFTADVHDFTMGGFTIAGVPYSVSSMMGDMEEVDSITEGLEQLSSGISSLAGAAGQLSNGAGELAANSSALTQASDQIAAALNQMSEGLQDFDISSMTGGLGQLAALPSGLMQIASGLSGAAGEIQAQMSKIPEVDIATMAGLFATISDGLDDEGDEAAAAAAALGQLQQTLMGLSSLSGLADKMNELVGGLNDAANGLMQMAAGISSGLSGMTNIDTSGIDQLKSGMAELAVNYADFNAGLKTYTDGVGTLSDGMGSYASGMYTLNNETKNIPEILDEVLGTGEDETEETGPVSFLDERNEDTASVQFVLSTEGISAPEQDEPEPPAEEDKGFFADLWDKLVALFT